MAEAATEAQGGSVCHSITIESDCVVPLAYIQSKALRVVLVSDRWKHGELLVVAYLKEEWKEAISLVSGLIQK